MAPPAEVLAEDAERQQLHAAEQGQRGALLRDFRVGRRRIAGGQAIKKPVEFVFDYRVRSWPT